MPALKTKSEESLLSSAKEFLVESIKNYNDRKLKFAIVHAITATELVLKEKLHRLNPALILRNIDTQIPNKEQTISLRAIPQRFANLGFPLKPTHTVLINTIAVWRNQIIHHMPAFNAEIALQQLPRLLEFLVVFLREELRTPLEAFLPKDLFRVANRLLKDWQKAISSAQAIAADEGNVITDACPKCAGVSVMCLRKDSRVHCHLCGESLYLCDHCDGCGRTTVTSYEPFLGENYCDDCIDAAGDQYISMLTDISLGK